MLVASRILRRAAEIPEISPLLSSTEKRHAMHGMRRRSAAHPRWTAHFKSTPSTSTLHARSMADKLPTLCQLLASGRWAGVQQTILSAITQHTTIIFHSNLQPVHRDWQCYTRIPIQNNTSTFACFGVQECLINSRCTHSPQF